MYEEEHMMSVLVWMQAVIFSYFLQGKTDGVHDIG